MRTEDAGAVVLAGGRARRLGGGDKAFLRFCGQYLIEQVLASCEQLFAHIVVVTRTPEHYRQYPVMAVTDLVDEGGSLAGLYTGLQVSTREKNFVVACDMPFLNPDFITKMAEVMRDEDDVLLPRVRSHVEPLHAFYSRRCIEPIRHSLKNRRYQLVSFHGDVSVRHIPESTARKFDPELKMFANINRASDLQRYSGRGVCETSDDLQ